MNDLITNWMQNHQGLLSFAPTEDEKARAMTTGLVGAGLGILSANAQNPRGAGFSGALGGAAPGFAMYQQTLAAAPRERMANIGAALQVQQLQRAAGKDQALQQFATGLPESDRAAFLLSPDAFIRERFGGFTLKPGERRFVGDREVAGVPDEPKMQADAAGVLRYTTGVLAGQVVPGFATPKAPEGMRYSADGRLEAIPEYTALRKDIAQAGRPVTNVNVNTGKTFGEAMGREFGTMIPQLRGEATSALSSIDASHQIQRAIDAGGVMAGPTATLRLRGAQVANMLGFTGQDAIVKTRETIQGLSKLAVGARQQLKGQGQITEGEQRLIEKAESGNIDDLTIPEIRTIAQVAERGARLKITQFNEIGTGLSGTPEYEPLRQFFRVQEPAPYNPQRRATDRAEGFRVLGVEGK